MRRNITFVPVLVALVVLAAPPSARAALVTPVSAANNTTANTATDVGASVSVARLIDGSGLSGAVTEANFATITHNQTTNDHWVTKNPNGVSTKYYDQAGAIVPVIVFDLGAHFALTDLIAWRYDPFNAITNSAKTIDVDVSSNGTLWIDAAVVGVGNGVDTGMQVSLGGSFVAAFVRFTITDNYNGNRVGLGEVRFLGVQVPSPAAAGAALPLLIAGAMRRRRR